MAKKAKITRVGVPGDPKDYGFGNTWYRKIELDNGDKGSIGTKEQDPEWLSVGKDLEYTMPKPETIKRHSAKGGRAPYKSKPKSDSSIFPVGVDKMLFIDAETCGICANLWELDEDLKNSFESRFDWWAKRFPEYAEDQASMFENRSALVAEFSKILTISIGWVKDGEFVVKSFSGLEEVRGLLDMFFDKGYYLVGHNVKNFDLPLIAKKCISEGLRPPKFAPVYDQKPWELKVIDTSIYYKFGNGFSLSNIDIISCATGIETSKGGEVNGGDMHSYWYGGKGSDDVKMKTINKYCEADVAWLYNFIQHINNLS